MKYESTSVTLMMQRSKNLYLRMHLNGIHNLSRKEYEGTYGNAETVTRYWTCLICNKELKCQKGIIIQHLLNVHSMELVDYERQYMDAGDQVGIN